MAKIETIQTRLWFKIFASYLKKFRDSLAGKNDGKHDHVNSENWWILNPESGNPAPFNDKNFNWDSDKNRWVPLAEKEVDNLRDRWTMTIQCKVNSYKY